MDDTRIFSVIDGHVDLLYKMEKDKRKFSEHSQTGHCDLPRMKKGNVLAVLLAIYPSSKLNHILKGLDLWFKFISNPVNEFMQIKKVDDFEKAENLAKRGAVLHFEGAGGIDDKFRLLRIGAHLGLRSLGLSWSNVNKYATGAMFKNPQKTTGLTEIGKKLVIEAQSLGITVDVSHLNDPSFWNFYEITEKPFFASHSNARSIANHPRNLTDDQIKAIHEKHGTVGINFSMGFLNAENPGKENYQMEFDTIKNHIDHIIDISDINTVAIGSDFDGTTTPNCLRDCSKFPDLWNYLLENGYSNQDIDKISHENLLRLFKETWN
ncbi:MAG: dipeptidase [Promethearchaeota archaeon]